MIGLGFYMKMVPGHIENSKGKQFCSFDYTTQEVKDLNNRWQFMNEYPYRTPWEMCQDRY